MRTMRRSAVVCILLCELFYNYDGRRKIAGGDSDISELLKEAATSTSAYTRNDRPLDNLFQIKRITEIYLHNQYIFQIDNPGR